MGTPRCTGDRCSKFAHQKKLVNQHQKAKGIDERTLCVSCAKTLYTGFVGLVCLFAGCMTAQQGGKRGKFCTRHSTLECLFANCTTTPKGGEHGLFCTRHSGLECEHADCTTPPKGGVFGPFCTRHTTLECEHADCTTAPQGGEHRLFCTRHSGLECKHADCTTAPQGGAFGKFCTRHSTYIKPIILVEETAENVEELKVAAIYNLDKGKHGDVRFGRD